jgi:hypothetical protein
MAPVTINTVNIELRNNSQRVGALCFPVERGKLTLKLTGKGDRTQIEQVIS